MKNSKSKITEIFSQEKSFKGNKYLGSPFLNKLGLHVFRLLLGHLICNIKYLFISNLVTKEQRREFSKNGFIIINNVLPDVTFNKVENEVNNYTGPGTSFYEGSTKTDRVRLSPDRKEQYPECYEAIKEKEISNLIKYCFGSLNEPLCFIQVIHNLWRNKGSDTQRLLHADTFHPTTKFWLYINDITEEVSPLNYIVGSHKLSFKRIIWEYKKSIVAREFNDGGTEQGSFRLTEHERCKLGLNQAKKIVVPKNSLVIVNTYGFHCRGTAIKKGNRIEIWGYNRDNPFSFDKGSSSILQELQIHRNLDAAEHKRLKKVGDWANKAKC